MGCVNFNCLNLLQGIWLVVSSLGFKSADEIRREQQVAGLAEIDMSPKNSNYLTAVIEGAVGFGESIYVGAKLVFTNRRFICMFFR